MSTTTIFFDLDNTLYPSDNGLWTSIRDRMNDYMQKRLNLPPVDISKLRRTYFETYGTTLRGLQIHYDVDADDFLAYVHDLPIEEIIKPDPGLCDMLLSMPQRKLIFTNSNIEHANRVLSALGTTECFEKIIDLRAMNFNCKPNPQAYQIALNLSGERNPSSCIYIDDSVLNLKPAFEMGFYTILIGRNGTQSVAYQVLKRPQDLRHAMPELWLDK